MTRYADLHIHTFFSDSTSSPEEVLEQAFQNGLSCIAITDHDTVDGVEPSRKAAEKYGIEVISGIELSCEIKGKDIHMLGYLFDPEDGPFLDKIRIIQSSRVGRMRAMIEKLANLGIGNITLDEVCALAHSDSVGRPHLAMILKEKGWVNSPRMAFDKYLSEEAPAYVPKFKQSPYEAIALIRQAGGVAVLAHPMLTRIDDLIPGLVDAGLEGLEVYYPNNTESITCFYEGLAQKHGLIATGGSDAHGSAKQHTFVGKLKIPYNLVEILKGKRASLF